MQYIKIFIVGLSLLGVFLAGGVWAQETSVEAVVEAESVTNEDLGVGDPRLLPTSPFYFFKEIGRGFQRAITFNSVAKTELELKIASEKAAEARKVAENDPGNERGIARALENYERGQERLRQRLESLKETSENPNVDRLLDMVAQRAVVHEKLLEELQAKHGSQKDVIGGIRTRVQKTFGEIAKKDDVETFHKRLQRAFEDTRGSALKHIRSVEVLDRLRESDELSQEARERLDELRSNFSEKAKESIERFADQGEEGRDRLQKALGRIPGDAFKRTVVLEELRARVSDRAADVLREARDSLDKKIQDGEDLAEQVRKRIQMTEERVEKAEERILELGDRVPQSASTLLENAKKHIEGAKTALQEKNPKNAFGQWRAAESIVENVMRILSRGVDTVKEDAPQVLERVKERVKATPLRPLERRPEDRVGSPEADAIACTQEYAPVCGVNGKTYSNRCVATQQNKVRVQHEGECRATGLGDGSGGCGAAYEPVCGVDGKTYTNAGCASVAGVRVRHRGECRAAEAPALVPGENPLRELRREDLPKVQDVVHKFTIQADDFSFSPAEIRVQKGAKVRITFQVDSDKVYFGGLDFRSSKFTTDTIKPGDSTAVEFTADESFEFRSYWPVTDQLKATGKVIVE